MPGPGRGPPGAGRGAPGRGGMPGVGPPPGRGGTEPGRAGAGRAGIAPGLGRGGMPGAGAAGRAAGGRGGMPGVPSAGVLNGLLPGRGPGGAGRGGRSAGAGAGARSGAGAGRAGPGTGPDGRAGAGVAGAGATGAGAAGADPAVAGPAGAGGAGAAAAGAGDVGRGGAGAAGGAAGKASRSLRTTGASTVEEADLTNSPCSFSQVRTFLLSIPSSLASSWTRALPGTVLLLGPGRPWPDCYCMGVLIGAGSSGVHSAVDPLSLDGDSALDRERACSPATCARTEVTSSGPARRRARGNARRFSARSTQRGSRCTKAPRPGRRPAGSGVRDAVP